MIEIKNITKIYGKGDTEVRAVAGITFTVKDGEFVAIMGHPRGARHTDIRYLLSRWKRCIEIYRRTAR